MRDAPSHEKSLLQDVDATEEQRVKQVRVAVTRKIKDLGRAGKAREAVQQLAEMARLGVQPDSMLGTALVDACARSGHMQMAQAAFEELFGMSTLSALLKPGLCRSFHGLRFALVKHASCSPPHSIAMRHMYHPLVVRHRIECM